MTLDVSTDARPEPELLSRGEDHSGCALPRIEQHETGSTGFVQSCGPSGLPDCSAGGCGEE
jgi:hypothetical protein